MPYEESSGGNNHDKIHEISHGSRRSSSSGSNSNGRKYLGVRQRPSGKWVAEIKDSSQKLRVWLGTFDGPEDAAASYDTAARLLRGRNAKTNFHNQGPAAAENRSLVVKNRSVYQMLRQAIMKNHTKSRDLEFDRRVEETIFCPSDSGQKISGSGLSLGSSKVYSSVVVAPSFTAANCLCQVGAEEEEEEDCSKESQS